MVDIRSIITYTNWVEYAYIVEIKTDRVLEDISA
jgi:hypothetical protein